MLIERFGLASIPVNDRIRYEMEKKCAHAKLASGWPTLPLPGGTQTRLFTMNDFRLCHNLPLFKSFPARNHYCLRLNTGGSLASARFSPLSAWVSQNAGAQGKVTVPAPSGFLNVKNESAMPRLTSAVPSSMVVVFPKTSPIMIFLSA